MINTLLSYDHLCRNPKRRAGIQVAVKLWKGARGDLQADTMALFEHLRSVPAINRETINPTRLDQRWLVHALSKTRAHHTIAEALCEAAGPDIDEFRHEICVGRGG